MKTGSIRYYEKSKTNNTGRNVPDTPASRKPDPDTENFYLKISSGYSVLDYISKVYRLIPKEYHRNILWG